MRRASPMMLLAFVQAVAGASVGWRLARTARGERIATCDAPLPGQRVTVLVPVLNERARLRPCLEGLAAQPDEVAEIFVIDGGSRDGTQDLVRQLAACDSRIRLLNAGPLPAGWNGKAHNLQVGLAHADPGSAWILTIDADVRPAPTLVRSLLAHAVRQAGTASISLATTQCVSGAAEGLVHPALLTTLVYRFGIPGHATRRVAAVQANGQCAIYRGEALVRGGGLAPASASLCEDVTLARALARQGWAIGFYESDGLAVVTMYESWREAWRNWSRSLPLRDRYAGIAGWLGLLEVTLAQAAPLPVLLIAWLSRASRPVLAINAALLAMRLGVLTGTARAYVGRPWTYWCSPLADLPVAVQLWRSALQRRHVWRGQTVERGREKDSG